MYNGIDISSYQNGINFDSIKENCDFVILRGGYTGWGTGVDYNKDKCFDNFYSECKKRNIPVGVYWYSCANSYEKGVAEANFIYDKCLKDRQFEYPIYIDVEEDRHQKIGKKYVTDAIIGFCETLEKLGYYVGIYANRNYFDNYIDTPKLSRYDKWLAVWTTNKPSFNYGNYGLWQNSDNGYINGIRVDTDISYQDYPSIIKNAKLNGFNNIIDELDKYTDSELAKMIWQGKFGNGEERKNKLGKRYENVQNLVNKGVGKLKSNNEIAKEVIEGKWKNYPERKILLENEGYNYEEIQKIVNDLMR